MYKQILCSYMKRVNPKEIDEILSTSNDELRDVVKRSAKYVYRFFGDRKVGVIVDKDNSVYIGVVSEEDNESITLQSPCLPILDDGFQIKPYPSESVTVTPKHVFYPDLTGLPAETRLVVHDTVTDDIQTVPVSKIPYPLRNRVFTRSYPKVLEYHTVVGEVLVDDEGELVMRDDPIELDADTIQSGYLTSDKKLPRGIVNQPFSKTLHQVPYNSYPVITTLDTVYGRDFNHNTSYVSYENLDDFLWYVFNHPRISVVGYHASAGRPASTDDLFHTLRYAYEDMMITFGESGVVQLTPFDFSDDVRSLFHDIVDNMSENLISEEFPNDEDREANKDGTGLFNKQRKTKEETNQEQHNVKEEDNNNESNEENGELDIDISMVVVFGKDTGDKNKIKYPHICIGSYSIPIAKILPKNCISDPYEKLLENLLLDNGKYSVDNRILSDIVKLFSHYDPDTDMLKTKPIASASVCFDKYKSELDDPNIPISEILQNRNTKHSLVVDGLTNFVNMNSEMIDVDDHDLFPPLYSYPLPHLGNRSTQISDQGRIVTTITANQDTWLASTDLFTTGENETCTLPTALTTEVNNTQVSYTPVNTVLNDEGTVRFEPVEDRNTAVEFTESGKFNSDNLLSNNRLAEAIVSGDILPPVSSRRLDFPKPI